MGNESGYGENFAAALRWTRQKDPTRLTHYESCHNPADGYKPDYSPIDLHSRMYASVQEMTDYCENSPDKPFLLCEYVHAMGNGPGDIEDYYQAIETYDTACGGFVWEWCDHSVYAGITAENKPIYRYGGDSGEYPHDGNFCMHKLAGPGLFGKLACRKRQIKRIRRNAVCREHAAQRGIISLHFHSPFAVCAARCRQRPSQSGSRIAPISLMIASRIRTASLLAAAAKSFGSQPSF